MVAVAPGRRRAGVAATASTGPALGLHHGVVEVDERPAEDGCRGKGEQERAGAERGHPHAERRRLARFRARLLEGGDALLRAAVTWGCRAADGEEEGDDDGDHGHHDEGNRRLQDGEDDEHDDSAEEEAAHRTAVLGPLRRVQEAPAHTVTLEEVELGDDVTVLFDTRRAVVDG